MPAEGTRGRRPPITQESEDLFKRGSELARRAFMAIARQDRSQDVRGMLIAAADYFDRSAVSSKRVRERTYLGKERRAYARELRSLAMDLDRLSLYELLTRINRANRIISLRIIDSSSQQYVELIRAAHGSEEEYRKAEAALEAKLKLLRETRRNRGEVR